MISTFQGHTPVIHPTAWVHPTACIIGQVTIGAHSSVWPYCVIRGDVGAITIGAGTNVQDGTIIHVTHAGPYTGEGANTVIGDNVTIGHRAILHACTIESNAFIGIASTILDQAMVRSYAMLGANTLVTGKQIITGKTLWFGQPATAKRSLTNDTLSYIDYSAQHYQRIMAQYQST